MASEAALDIAVSKPRALALATELGIAVPKSVVVTRSSDVRAAINEVGCPAVIKPVQSWGESNGVGSRHGAESGEHASRGHRARGQDALRPACTRWFRIGCRVAGMR